VVLGYYLAHTETLHGDEDLSARAFVQWRALTQGTAPAWGRFDGVSIWIDDSGATHTRITAQCFFGLTDAKQYPGYPVFFVARVCHMLRIEAP
jgi:hypothetical protein